MHSLKIEYAIVKNLEVRRRCCKAEYISSKVISYYQVTSFQFCFIERFIKSSDTAQKSTCCMLYNNACYRALLKWVHRQTIKI